MKYKMKPYCMDCGSDDILFDASARYNSDTGEHELVTTYDETHCAVCEGTDINWVSWTEK